MVGLVGCAKGPDLKAIPYDQVTYSIPHPWVEKHGVPGRATRLITAAMTGDPKTFNDYMEQDFTSSYALGQAYEGLLANDIKTAQPYPDLAQSWTESPDHLHIVFELRRGLRWSDGVPLTAHDVAFTYNDIIMNPKIPDNNSVDELRIDGKFPKVTALDARHVRFDLPGPFSPFFDTMAGMPIMPEHQWKKYVNSFDQNGRTKFYQAFDLSHDFQKEPLVGSGPYIPVFYKTGEYIVLERNPYYAQRVDKLGHHLPYADQMLFEITPDAHAEALKFMAGETDVSMDIQRAADYEYLKRLETVGHFHMVNGGTDFGSSFFVFNLNRDHDPHHKPYVDPLHESWFSNVHFRRAFSHCVDRHAIIDAVSYGIGTPAYGPESPASPFYDPDIPKYRFDLNAARQELIEGGFHPGDTTHPCTDAKGNPISFDCGAYTENRNSIIVSNMVKSELARLGITMNVQVMAFNTLLTKMGSTLDFEVAIMNLSGGPDPQPGVNVWMHNGRLHEFWQRSPRSTDVQAPYPWELQVDRDFIHGAQVYGFENRKNYYWDYQRVIAEEEPQVYIQYGNPFFAVHDAIRNAMPSAMQIALGYNGYLNDYQLYK